MRPGRWKHGAAHSRAGHAPRGNLCSNRAFLEIRDQAGGQQVSQTNSQLLRAGRSQCREPQFFERKFETQSFLLFLGFSRPRMNSVERVPSIQVSSAVRLQSPAVVTPMSTTSNDDWQTARTILRPHAGASQGEPRIGEQTTADPSRKRQSMMRPVDPMQLQCSRSLQQRSSPACHLDEPTLAVRSLQIHQETSWSVYSC